MKNTPLSLIKLVLVNLEAKYRLQLGKVKILMLVLIAFGTSNYVFASSNNQFVGQQIISTNASQANVVGYRYRWRR